MNQFALVQNGQMVRTIPLDTPFNIGDQQFSASFLRTSTHAEKLAVGIWDIIQGAYPDDRYYWVAGPSYRVNEVDKTVEASYSGTAKNLDDLKKAATAQVRATAYSILFPSDWMATKAFETSTTVPTAWATWRAEIRAEAANAVTAIAVATDIPSLITASTVVWAHDPNYVPPTQEEQP